MIEIIKDFIPAGKENRPHTNPRSSLYKKIMKPEYITYHNPAWPGGNAKAVHDYGRRQWVRPGVKSWHFSVDKGAAYQMLPLDEGGWHAGDNLGPGNTNSIGLEVCDRGGYSGNWDLFWADQDGAARLCAYLIKTVPSLKPFPDCMKQHHDWSGKNCPAWLRNNPGYWDRLLMMVHEYLQVADETKPKEPQSYRVVVASNTDYQQSVEDLRKTKKAFPTLAPVIRLNEVKGTEYYRVVLDEVERLDQARALTNMAKSRLSSGWIISEWEDIPLNEPDPKAEPDPEPPGDEMPSGLMELLKKLFELLSKIFGKEG